MSQISQAIIRFQSAINRFRRQVENSQDSWNDDASRQFVEITLKALSSPAALVTKEMQKLELTITQARSKVN